MTTRPLLAAASLLILAACTNSAVQTGEFTSGPTAKQIAAFRDAPPVTINPYTLKPPAPKMGRNGCSISVEKRDGALLVPAFNPLETYCVRIAPYHNTTISLPPGARLQNATSSLPYVQITSAPTNELDALLLSLNCVPVRKGEDGNYQRPALYDLVTPQTLHSCPVPTADLTVVMSTGIARWRLLLNESSHDSLIVMNEAALEPRTVQIPRRPAYARDLVATSVDGQMIPWTPDYAWEDGSQVVIGWTRQLAQLPMFLIGPEGEQSATPRVITTPGEVAMVFPAGVTRFQLRIDDRILSFSEADAPKPFIRPAGA